MFASQKLIGFFGNNYTSSYVVPKVDITTPWKAKSVTRNVAFGREMRLLALWWSISANRRIFRTALPFVFFKQIIQLRITQQQNPYFFIVLNKSAARRHIK